MADEPRSLIESFLGAFTYPFRSPGGWGFLLAGTAALTLTHGLRTGLHRDPTLYLLALSALLIASYLYRIVEETVTGNDRPPSLQPEVWEDAGHDLLHYAGGVLVAFLPVLILLFYAMSEQRGHLGQPRFQALLGGLLFLGTLYFPMALLLNGFSQRFATAFNLSVGFRGILTMGCDYALCSVFFLLAHGTWILLEILWVGETPRGLNGARMGTSAVTSLIGLYLSVVQMRALGLLYRKHQERLRWSLGADA
jgi:hypothetical protein